MNRIDVWDDVAAVASWTLTPEVDAPKVILTDERKTPRWLIEELQKEFDFQLDAAATLYNALASRYYGLDHWNPECRDGLAGAWMSTTWCNPPYSRGSILKWCAKAAAEAAKGVTTVMLLPGDTSTEYFHRYVLTNEHRFLKSRLKFEGAPLDGKGKLASAKFGSVLVIFRPEVPWTRG